MNFKINLVLASIFTAFSVSAVAAPAPERFAPKRILVQVKPGLSSKSLDKILEPHGGKRIGHLEKIGVHVIELPAAGSEKAVAAMLAKDPSIESAEVDGIMTPNYTPNDPYYPSEWHMPLIGLPSAWDLSQGSGVTIAVLDSGIDSANADLAPQLVAGWNFFDNNSNLTDVTGHGTKVAGTAAAVTGNSTAVAGAAPLAKIMPIRISDTAGYAYWSTAAQAAMWAADNGAKVVNMSYGPSGSGSSTIINAGNYVKSKGGVFIVSAGNSGLNEGYAASDALISVSATDSTDTVTSWSSFGPYVDVAAPGAGILTTSPGGGVCNCSGTSFSAPLTAGVVALMMSANTSLTPDQVTSLLKSTSKDLGTAGFDNYYGYGRIDAAAAVSAAKAAVPADTSAPVVAISSPASGTVLKGSVTLAVTASDNVGVSKVDMSIDGVLVATDLASPYEFVLDTSTLTDGTHTVTVTAYDAAGNKTSSQRSYTVSNTADAIAPVVTVSSPTSGSVLSRTANLSVKASATDNVAVTSMAVSYDGTKVASSTSGSISYSLSAKKVTSGSHTVVVVASDAAGNSSSKTVTFTK